MGAALPAGAAFAAVLIASVHAQAPTPMQQPSIALGGPATTVTIAGVVPYTVRSSSLRLLPIHLTILPSTTQQRPPASPIARRHPSSLARLQHPRELQPGPSQSTRLQLLSPRLATTPHSAAPRTS